MPISPIDYSAGQSTIDPLQVARQYQGLQSDKLINQQNQLKLQQQQQAPARMDAFKMGLQQLDRTDPQAVANFNVQFPEFAEQTQAIVTGQQDQTQKAYDFKSQQEKDLVKDASGKLLQVGMLGKPELLDQAIDQLADVISNTGDPSMTPEVMKQRARENPEQFIQGMAGVYNASGGDAADYGYQSITKDERPGAQEILEDGTIIQSTSKGPKVYSADGQLLTGKKAKEAILKARELEVSNARSVAGAKREGALEAEKALKAEVEAGVVTAVEAAKASVDAFGKLEKINKNIGNVDEAIKLIDEGAETGVIQSKLPSISAASIKLDNLQGRLGLDVIGETTFGALSGSELEFALNTALPKKLKGPDLRQWLVEKKAAQEKLSDYLESAAIFLGIPGNTHAMFLKKKKLERNKKTAPAQRQQQTQQSDTPEQNQFNQPVTGFENVNVNELTDEQIAQGLGI